MTLEQQVLTTAVVVLYAISASLIAASLVGRRLRRRRQEAHAQTVERLRAPVEAWFLSGQPMPLIAPGERDALLDLALRYTAAVRGASADRLVAGLEEHGVISYLIDRVHVGDEWQRAEAAEMLGRLRVGRAVPHLVAALDDEMEDVRTVAARGLAAIGDPRAVGPLARALNDPSRWTLSLVAENLMVMGPEAVPPLLDLLVYGEYNVRVSAVQILGQIRDPRATRPLVTALAGETNLNLRAQAAAALGKLGGPDAETALVDALADPEWQVRAQAAKGLGRIGRPSVAGRLAEAMPDQSWWVRVNCAEALVRLGATGRAHLERLAEHADRYVREQAVAALDIYGLREQPAGGPTAVLAVSPA
jgi:HEAT repeat protein